MSAIAGVRSLPLSMRELTTAPAAARPVNIAIANNPACGRGAARPYEPHTSAASVAIAATTQITTNPQGCRTADSC